MEEVKSHLLHAPAMKEGHLTSSYKRPPSPHFSHTPPCEGSLSLSRIIPPWSRISEIHVPGGFIWKGVAASAALLDRGTEVVGVPDVCAITDAPLLCGAGLGGAGAGSDGCCAGHGERGNPPPPIKDHPFPPASTHLLVKDLSPPLVLFPMVSD